MMDRSIWEGYSYSLSGLIYCADCGRTEALSVPMRSTVEDTTIPILPFNAETIEAKMVNVFLTMSSKMKPNSFPN